MKESISKASIIEVIKIYWRECCKYPKYSLGSFIAPSIGSILIFYVPPLFVARIINHITGGNLDWNWISLQIILFGCSWFLGEIFWRIGFYFLIRLQTKSMGNLLELSNIYLLSQDYRFFSENFTGSLVKKSSAFRSNFEPITDALSFHVFNNIIPTIFAFGILFYYSWYLPLILLIFIVLTTLIAIPIIRKRARLVVERQNAGSILTGMVADTLGNIFAVKSFAKESNESHHLKDQSDDFMKKWLKTSDFQNLYYDMIITPLYVLINVIGLLVSVYLFSIGEIQVGELALIFSYYAYISRVLWDINHIYRTFESRLIDAAEFVELVIEKPTIQDVEDAKPLKLSKGEIIFENVGFNYPRKTDIEKNSQCDFFSDFSLTIKPGEKIGLVGPSGGGKSTITKLLLRFIDIQEGNIYIDNQNIKKITQQSLRENISYIPQEPLLFHRSLFENIRYGMENASMEDVIQATKLAHAHDFISETEDGYETLVGERGIKLSGGQKQRVAIARAILKDAKIIILDEATSALDSESEKYIQEGLSELLKDKTAIVIAHRLSTIRNLDRIIVLDNGTIVEEGKHNDLIQKGGIYARLWSHQSGDFIE